MSDLTNHPPEPASSPADISLPAPRHNATWVFHGADGLRAGWGLLVFVAIFLVLSLATQSAVKKVRHSFAVQHAGQQHGPDTPPASQSEKALSPASTTLREGSAFLIVLVSTFLLSRIERRPFTAFGLGGSSRLPQFFQGLLCGAVCLSGLVATLHLAGFLPFDARLLTLHEAFRFAALWAIGFSLVALLEETLLRGYVQYTLARGLAGIYGAVFNTRHRRALGFWTAALFLSFVFGLGHGSNPGESPIGLLSAGTAGLIFCLALYRTGSLWWAIGFHASWDWAQSFLYGVADSGTMVQGHLLATHPVGKPILSGGLTGPEGSLLVLPTLAVAAAIIYLTLPRSELVHPDT